MAPKKRGAEQEPAATPARRTDSKATSNAHISEDDEAAMQRKLDAPRAETGRSTPLSELREQREQMLASLAALTRRYLAASPDDKQALRSSVNELKEDLALLDSVLLAGGGDVYESDSTTSGVVAARMAAPRAKLETYKFPEYKEFFF
jgi:hypothetical protein